MWVRNLTPEDTNKAVGEATVRVSHICNQTNTQPTSDVIQNRLIYSHAIKDARPSTVMSVFGNA